MRRKHYNKIQHKLNFLQLIPVSAFFGTGDESKMQNVFYLKNAKETLRNKLKPASNGYVQIRAAMLDHTDIVKTSKKSTARLLSTQYAFPFQDYTKSDTSRS